MRWRRGRAVQLCGEARPTRDRAAAPTKRSRLRVRRRRGIAGGETETANEHGEPKVRRLSKLPVEQGKEAGRVKHDRENLAAFQLPVTEDAKVEREQGAP